MIYTSRFYANGRVTQDNTELTPSQYLVTIQTPTGSAVRSVTLGATPFTVKYKGSEAELFKPVKYSGATVTLVDSDYHFDLFSKVIGDVTVTLQRRMGESEQPQTVWKGVVTPNLYDQGYDNYLEEIELECIDMLSTLQYRKYQAETRQIRTFGQVLSKVLAEAEIYYIATDTHTAERLKKLLISEQNFFDKKESNETDQEVAWECSKVLEEMCQFLGVTAMQDINNVNKNYPVVLLVPYKQYGTTWSTTDNFKYYHLASYNNDYGLEDVASSYKVPSLNNNGVQEVSIPNSDVVMRAPGSVSLSLDPVYNKVSVKAEPYTFDEVLPNPFDNLTNITASTDSGITSTWRLGDGGLCEIVQNNLDTKFGNTNMQVLLDFPYSPDDKRYSDNYNAIFVKYCTCPDYVDLYRYNASGVQISVPSSICYSDTRNYCGALLAKMDVTKCDKITVPLDEFLNDYFNSLHGIGLKERLDKSLSGNGKTQVKMSDYICLFSNSDSYTPSNYPYVRFKAKEGMSLFGGTNGHLIISGTYSFHEFPSDPYPIPGEEVDIKNGKRQIWEEDAVIKCSLRWGNLWWNGSSWVSGSATFTIPYIKERASGSDKRADTLMFKDNQLRVTNTWRMGVDKDGYEIPVPGSGTCITGSPELTIYGPIFPRWGDKGRIHKPRCVFIKNFKMYAVIGDPSYSGVLDTDTVYTNVINERFVEEKDEISFKICTYDDKNPTYSAVGFRTTPTGTVQFLDRQAFVTESEQLRAEEACIHRYVTQYSSPSIVLERNIDLRYVFPFSKYYLEQFGTWFVIDQMNIDWRKETANIRFVEIK